MTQDRREFLERIATGAVLATFPTSIDVLGAFRSPAGTATGPGCCAARVTGSAR